MSDSRAARKRRRLAGILQGDACVLAGSVFDPLSARIADEVGCQVGVLGGSIASLAILGAPDLMLITLTELVEQVRRSCRNSEVAVVVDADHGFGNALNVMRAVDELAAAGVAAVSIEDTMLPRRFGAGEQPELVSVEEGAGKLRAAVEAARDSGVLVFGRTNALAITGLQDTIARFRAYERVGVQALFLPYVKSRGELDEIAAATTLPIVLGAPADAVVEMDYLARRRVRVCLRGHQPFNAAVSAMHATALAMARGEAPGALPGIASGDTLARLSASDQYKRWTNDYLEK